jgi:Ca2+-binding EF-hand superfamily protein
MASFNEFTIDKQEYMAVFKFFDRENKGEISINQVTEFIHKFDSQMTAISPTKAKSTKDDANPP